MSNRLSSSSSPYLRSAAHQPVHWHAWGEDAFAQAVREDKPILLDSGAVWCHWCHVMDHESYEDAELAKVINTLFVAVKLDRDERPDVDARYQKVVQAMTGQGGWPLTAFLLPDGRAFYGGTYFPPRDAHGRPSFRRVLEAVAEAYRARRGEVEESATHLEAHLSRAVQLPPAPEGSWPALLGRATGAMRAACDLQFGGFGGAPKFPHPAAQDLLVAQGLDGDAAARDVVLFTLERMRAGGIHDHLAGGFHRYSVDARWHVPHFEKMLYDNAGLLRNYARAGAAFDRPDLLDTGRDIVRFLREVLRQDAGGFGGSQDADTGPGDDGDHFTWTLDELREAIGDDERLARIMAARYGVRAEGDMHHDSARNVLQLQADAAAIAAAFRMREDEARTLVAEGDARMRAARAKRAPVPFVDPVRYTAWNAMAAGALFELAAATDDADLDALALETVDALLAGAYEKGRGFARSVGSGVFGLLDDNANALDALLDAYAATGEARHLDAARDVGELLVDRFAHPDGGFRDRAEGLAPHEPAAPLARAERPTQDAPTASPNGVACRALLRLGEATGDARYSDAARAALHALSGEAERLGLFGGALLLAMREAAAPPPRIVLAGVEDAAWRRAARRSAPPGAAILRAGDANVPEEAASFRGPGAIVCVGTRCLAPARSPAELSERLASLRAEGLSAP